MTAVELEGFQGWLRSRGRAESTQRKYSRALSYLFSFKDVLEPILNRKYTPNYRHFLVSSLRQWSLYKNDMELFKKLNRGTLKLPPAIRTQARTPCDRDLWFSLMDLLEGDETDFEPPIRSVLGLIVTRGIRCGDVLRVTKKEIDNALRTGVFAFEGKGSRRIEYNAEPIKQYLVELSEQRWPKRARLYDLICPDAKRPEESASRKIRRYIDLLADEVGVDREDLFAHRFRHTYANEFLSELSGDPRAVFLLQEQMGWAGPETARSYIAIAGRKELNEVETRLFSGRKKKDVAKKKR